MKEEKGFLCCNAVGGRILAHSHDDYIILLNCRTSASQRKGVWEVELNEVLNMEAEEQNNGETRSNTVLEFNGVV